MLPMHAFRAESPRAPYFVPLERLSNHPVTAALCRDGLVRRWLIPEAAAAADATLANLDRSLGLRQTATAAACLPAGLTRAGLAQAVGFTSVEVSWDGSVQYVHMMLFPYASVNGITLGVYASHTETALYPGPGPPTFARFVLDEAARTLVTVGQQATGGGLSCSAASGGGRCSVSDSTMPAAPLPPARWSMTVRGAGAAGTPYGALTVGEVIDLPMPVGWVPAPEVASVVALPPGPPTSPVDFGGFDGSVRQLLGDAVTRRGARSHPYPPTVVTASLPVPFAAVSMTVPAAPPSIFPDAPPPISLVPAFYRLPGPAGARLEVALVQATLTSAVPTLNWSAPSPPSSETLPLPGGDIGLASLAAPRRLRTPRRAADEPDRASRRWAQQMRNRVAAARCNEVARKRRLAAKAAATAAAAAAAEDTTKSKDKEEGAVGGSKGGVHTETGQKATSDASTGTQWDNRESRRGRGVHFGVMHD